MDQPALQDFIVAMTQLLQSAKTFAATQLPDVLQEVLRYETAKSRVWLAVGSILLLSSVGLLAWFFGHARKYQAWRKEQLDLDAKAGVYRSWPSYRGRDPDHIFPVVVVSGFASLAGFIITLENSLTLIQLQVAPKVFLLEYLADLVNRSHA